MPRFLIFPFDQTFSSTKLIAPDAANLLLTIQRLECKEAEVKRDGEYAFSARSGVERIRQIEVRAFEKVQREIYRLAHERKIA